ncbi:MAG: HAD-IA family hydrolase [Bacteroidales bacterium]|nr:HAD-IA family hydrolase [Bacteroidales bacterium]MDT8373274.1 HAD-IA family hydrolase [Bacteroidales bacterium]
MDKNYIIFDFDGTLADTLELAFDIYNGIAQEYGCNPARKEDRELLKTRKPQEVLMSYGITRLKLFSLLLRIRKELATHIPDVNPAKDIIPALRDIKNAGFSMGILTSNSARNVSMFLKVNNLSDTFDFIYSGKNYFGKAMVIRRLLDHEKISPESVIYVGDETRDVEASRKAGIRVIAVRWGLSPMEALAATHPDQIAETPKELLPCVRRIYEDNIPGKPW